MGLMGVHGRGADKQKPARGFLAGLAPTDVSADRTAGERITPLASVAHRQFGLVYMGALPLAVNRREILVIDRGEPLDLGLGVQDAAV